MVTFFLPNTGSSLASARISRRFSGFCKLFFLMYSHTLLTTSPRGRGLDPTTAASSFDGCKGFCSALGFLAPVLPDAGLPLCAFLTAMMFSKLLELSLNKTLGTFLLGSQAHTRLFGLLSSRKGAVCGRAGTCGRNRQRRGARHVARLRIAGGGSRSAARASAGCARGRARPP